MSSGLYLELAYFPGSPPCCGGSGDYSLYRTVLPDGSYLQGDMAMTTAGTEDRVKDLLFILEELSRWNANDAVFAGRLDLTRVGAIGASWGVTTVAKFGTVDTRCKAIIGLDPGASLSQLQLVRLDQPVLEINRPANSDTTLYRLSATNAIWFQISSTDHLLIAGGDWYWAWHPENVASGREVARTINAYTLWFLNKYLKGSTDPMPALADYPRVTNFQQK